MKEEVGLNVRVDTSYQEKSLRADAGIYFGEIPLVLSHIPCNVVEQHIVAKANIKLLLRFFNPFHRIIRECKLLDLLTN